MRQAAVLAFLVMVLSACTEPLEFADWAIPVPEGTRIIEYEAVPTDGRTERIELVEDLVLSGPIFYRPSAVTVDGDGNIYVLDAAEHQVVVFDSRGNHQNTFGGRGQGPGEFDRPVGLAIVGGRLVVLSSTRRMSVWSRDGEHLADHEPLSGSETFFALLGPASEQMVAAYASRRRDGFGARTTVVRVAGFSTDGQVLVAYVDLPRRAAIGGNAPVPRPQAMYAHSLGAEVYAIGGARYEVLALGSDAQPSWSLRVAQEPRPLTQADIDEAMAIVHRRRPQAVASELNWPERFPALSWIGVDGHGHVYVYPYGGRIAAGEDAPVDVYSAAGERLFAGRMPRRLPLVGDGDFVYSIDDDGVDGEYRVVRYRLVEPFE